MGLTHNRLTQSNLIAVPPIADSETLIESPNLDLPEFSPISVDTLLKKTANKWEFSSEQVLEDFIWNNLGNLFGLIPLMRRYTVFREIRNILAQDSNGQLVVIKIKNSQNRGIVQQLTRCYAQLIEQKPFFEQIDYDRQIRILAITPSFHKDSLLDKEYHKLLFEFWQFEIVEETNNLFLQVKNLDNSQAIKCEVPQKVAAVSPITTIHPEPPELQTITQQCNSQQQAEILRMRNHILKHIGMQETIFPGSIKYGRGKSKLCAEIVCENPSKLPSLYLHLPIPQKNRLKSIDDEPEIFSGTLGRMRILTDDWQSVVLIYYSKHQKSLSAYYDFNDFANYVNIENLSPQASPLDILIDIALENWLARY